MNAFEQRFDRPPEVTAAAPGRVNLIGEHTDYNQGFVLPTPIPQQATVTLAARADARVRVATLDLEEAPEPVMFQLAHEAPRGDWVDYVQGVTRALGRSGHAVPGFDALIASQVPVGGGLSSSAALTIALQRALRTRFGLVLDDVAMARIAQQAENEFVGARVGIMDPLAASLGREGSALFVDTRDLSYRSVPLPRSLEIVVVESGTGHRHATGEYNRRREECERACAALSVGSLRDLGPGDDARIAALPEPLNRRARHVVSENQRVLEAVAALEQNRPDELGRLIDASHRSLRDDYQVSTPAIDILVGLLRAEDGIYGVRLTGGGFGGAVLAVARPGAGPAAAAVALPAYETQTGNAPRLVLPAGRAPAGVR
jgi:galactokinase